MSHKASPPLQRESGPAKSIASYEVLYSGVVCMSERADCRTHKNCAVAHTRCALPGITPFLS
jgi:hypothetical protein